MADALDCSSFRPQCGHAAAVRETSPWQSGHLIKAALIGFSASNYNALRAVIKANSHDQQRRRIRHRPDKPNFRCSRTL
jgi:hypothetical protein